MKSLEEILDFAIANEQKAYELYLGIAELATRPGMRKAFLDFAAEEMKHKEKLESVKAGELPPLDMKQVETLGITEHLVDIEPQVDMSYQDALLFAMKTEQRAHDLYAGLAEAAGDTALAELFRSLSQEELKHKLLFEREYDEVVLDSN